MVYLNSYKYILIGIIAFLMSVGCAKHGYQVDLSIQNQSNTLALIKSILERESYVFAGDSAIQQKKEYKWREKYKKDLSESPDDYVIVDIVYEFKNIKEINVWIYNIGSGNDPTVKPSIIGIADEIEEKLKVSAPEINIRRKEYKTGYPIIL